MNKYHPDPRTLLCVVAMISSLSVFTRNLLIQLMLFGIVLVLYALFSLSFVNVIKKIRKMIPILVFVAIAQSIFVSGTSLIAVSGFDVVTVEGVIAGGMTFFRLLIIISSAYLFTSSSENDMIYGLTLMKVPYEITMMSMIGLRFLPSFYQEFSLCMESFELKGISFKQQAFKNKIKLIQLFVTPVLIRTILKAKRLAMSMDLKGFKAYEKRTHVKSLRLSYIDKAIMIVSLVMFVSVFVVERSFL